MSVDWTKPVQTRDGNRVRVLCTDRKDALPVLALVTLNPKHRTQDWEMITATMIDGRLSYGPPHPGDLVNVPRQSDD